MNTSAVSPGRAGLLLLLSGQMLPLIDTSITNVALDAITHTLAASATQLELIVALYGVAFAVCLAMTIAAGACLCGASRSLALLPCCAA